MGLGPMGSVGLVWTEYSLCESTRGSRSPNEPALEISVL